MNIKYPTWRVTGNPTPSDKLMVCATCGFAQWTTHNPLGPVLCYNKSDHPNGKNARMREATKKEYEEGRKRLMQETKLGEKKDEQELTDEFERVCGSVERAQRLFSIWKNSYADSSRRITKDTAFQRAALNDGFKPEELQAFYACQ